MLRIDWSTDYQRNAKDFEKHCKMCSTVVEKTSQTVKYSEYEGFDRNAKIEMCQK